MGLLRFLLALSVILIHTGTLEGLRFVDASIAVETFFIISGFYMALVLHEKYIGDKSAPALFYKSRVLRLFPAFLLILLLTVCVEMLWLPRFSSEMNAGYTWHTYGSHLTPKSAAFLAGVNVGIVGQDATVFLGIHPNTGALYPSRHALQTVLPAWRFLFVPPAWSLSLELMFYALAPFLVRRNGKTLLVIVAVSLLLRAVLYYPFHLRADPWTYRFFPNELAFFLIGAIGYKIYRRLRNVKHRLKAWPHVLWAMTLVSIVAYPHIPDAHGLGTLLYFALVAVSIPFIFLLTKNYPFDRYIGELSYPLYIVHWPLMVCYLATGHRHAGLVVPILSIGAALLVLKGVDQPVDALRQKWVQRAKVRGDLE